MIRRATNGQAQFFLGPCRALGPPLQPAAREVQRQPPSAHRQTEVSLVLPSRARPSPPWSALADRRVGTRGPRIANRWAGGRYCVHSCNLSVWAPQSPPPLRPGSAKTSRHQRSGARQLPASPRAPAPLTSQSLPTAVTCLCPCAHQRCQPSRIPVLVRKPPGPESQPCRIPYVPSAISQPRRPCPAPARTPEPTHGGGSEGFLRLASEESSREDFFLKVLLL